MAAEEVVRSEPTISLDAAHALIADCATKAAEIGKQMCIAICDQAGHLKAFARMDGAPLIALEIAQNKAYTAASFALSTDQWYEFIKDDPPLALGIVHTPRLIVFGGGFPIRHQGDVIGGIGVSGGHYTDDMACARFALERNGFAAE